MCVVIGQAGAVYKMRVLQSQLGCALTEIEDSGDRAPCCGYGGLAAYANPAVAGELTELTRGFDGRVETATVFYEVASEAVHSSLPLDKRICDIHPFKLVFRFTDPETTLEFRDSARRDARFGGCYFARSWPYGVECTNAASTKADMMEIVKRATGCRYTVAIGDYDNDVPMIKAADLGVAVKSGAECALQVADRVVCACEDGAVAELIYSL